jgi:anti-anti-sigma factor
LDEAAIHAVGTELIRLIEEDGCRRMVLSLGPGSLECLYSIFMAKLVSVQRRIQDRQGSLVLCDVTPEVLTVFEACRLRSFFKFAPDRAAAVEAISKKPLESQPGNELDGTDGRP